MPTPRLGGLAAARKVRTAIATLDGLIDRLRPTDVESHSDSARGRAWSSLVGAVARAGLRVDEVVEAESGFKASKRPFNSTVKRPEDPF